ncbi:MAG TPA: CpaF family protein [Acidimicrobiales bacterium]|nr:CpaF family protein [Acidimicrobiales bacterium]
MRPDLAGGAAALDERVHRRLLAAEGDGPLDDAVLTELVRLEDPLLDAASVAGVVARMRARMLGAGPIEPLLADPAITDVLVNGPGWVWVERAGRLVRTGIALDAAAIDLLVERVVSRLGLRADRSTPIVDARLPDGSRVHVVLPPLAVDGPYVTIRRFAVSALPLSRFCGPSVESLLVDAVVGGWNLVVCGGTGAGKTTLLNALCQHLPAGERVVTVEDAAELRLPGDQVVRLEARPATPDGLPAVAVRDLLRAALRMRPDRLVVGEVRGGEAVDLLQALNTGHDGSLSTCHANSPVDALRRLETMSLMGGLDLPLPAIREQLSSALDLVVHVARRPDGSRHVVSIDEVTPDPESPVRTRPLSLSDHVIATPSRPPRHVEPTP